MAKIDNFELVDEKIIIFSRGYLVGKTGEFWKVEGDRSYLDLYLNCSFGNISFSTMSVFPLDVETIIKRLDDIVQAYNRELLENNDN